VADGTGGAALNRGPRIALFAGIALLLGALLIPAAAPAAVKERVKLSIPDPGQLAAARLEFKVKGEKKPKLKIKAKNADALPDQVVAAAQMTRSTEKKGRAVALVAIGNPGTPAAAGRDARGTADSVLIEVRSTGTGAAVSDIEFSKLPSNSRNFLSVLGAEPAAERQLAQDVFRLGETEIPADPLGGLDLDAAFKPMELNPTRASQIITQDVINELNPNRMIASAIAAAVGPPAAIDGPIYVHFSGLPLPERVQETSGQSQANPSLVFVGIAYSFAVMGAQVSQVSGNMVLHTDDARCENGFLQAGTVTWGPGPFLPGVPGVSYRLDCDLPQDHAVVLFDVPMQEPPAAGMDVFNVMPIPFYGNDQLGEAVAAEATSYRVRF
jgi:hypothetical protein